MPINGCPLGALTHEHQKGRTLVGTLADTANAFAQTDSHTTRNGLVQVLCELMTLYPNHIWKEDYLLFPMANKLLTPPEQY